MGFNVDMIAACFASVKSRPFALILTNELKKLSNEIRLPFFSLFFFK